MDKIIFEGMTSVSALIKAARQQTLRRKILAVYFSLEKIKKEKARFSFLKHASDEIGFSLCVVPGAEIEKMVSGKTHGGIIAEVSQAEYPLLSDATLLPNNGFAVIIDGVEDKEHIGVCLDTCHIWDSGYDIVNDYENVISHFNDIIGLDNLKVIHVNDSKNINGSHKDRHENIGFGNIGFDTLSKFIFDERFCDKIKILETPYVKVNDKIEKPPYKYEINMLLNNKFRIKFNTNALFRGVRCAIIFQDQNSDPERTCSDSCGGCFFLKNRI